jgi:hypothetical protein
MPDAPREPRREVSPERFAYCEQQAIAALGYDRYAEFKAKLQALAATMTAEQWNAYVTTVGYGEAGAPEDMPVPVAGPGGVSGRSDRHKRHAGLRAAYAWGEARRGALLLPTIPQERRERRHDSADRRLSGRL